VRHQKEQYLFGYAPGFKKCKAVPMNSVLYYRDNIIKDQYFEEIALDKRVPNQVDPKAVPEKRQTFAVGRQAFPGDNENYPTNEYERCSFQ
jgi:hypothetical protein